jgi:Uma2 family endonuclease
MPIREKTYRRVSLEDPTGHWGLACGRLRSKPGMTTEHYDLIRRLARRLILQLNEREYDVGMDGPRLRLSTGSYYLPDVCVIPRAFIEQQRREAPRRLEVYDQPMPLVVEVWSPSTGDYDVEAKLREYQRRGDLESWRLHPYEKTLTRWLRRPDGSYEELLVRRGIVQPAALLVVGIDLDTLFD